MTERQGTVLYDDTVGLEDMVANQQNCARRVSNVSELEGATSRGGYVHEDDGRSLSSVVKKRRRRERSDGCRVR